MGPGTLARHVVALALTFAAWFAGERTLSIHTIYTTRREGFYWLAILFTFALGTAAGDLAAERLNLGYWVSAVMFGTLIAIVAMAHLAVRLNAVLAFWIAYILTRPLGASLGDYLSQSRGDGGLGLGTVVTSGIFLITILGVVSYLSVTRRDTAAPPTGRAGPGRRGSQGVHTAATTGGGFASGGGGLGSVQPDRGQYPALGVERRELGGSAGRVQDVVDGA